ncbi:hypothetical protein [Nonomuraea sp. LPB2021202275-12-8]|uniref:hypothetical protein n=1 Tax=Nonomuraea sp. LPB2021202275-12-8 TaxID=3120159 RepID=UPI00300DB3C9
MGDGRACGVAHRFRDAGHRLRRTVPPGPKPGAGQILARVSLGVALISVTASIAEMLVDLYVLSATDTREQLKALDQQIRSIPAAEQILYGFGTQLVYLGLLVLIIQLAFLKRISMTTLTLVLATLVLFISYELLDGPGRQALMPLAVLCMWLALAPLGWRLLKPAAPAGTSIRSGQRTTTGRLPSTSGTTNKPGSCGARRRPSLPPTCPSAGPTSQRTISMASSRASSPTRPLDSSSGTTSNQSPWANQMGPSRRFPCGSSTSGSAAEASAVVRRR